MPVRLQRLASLLGCAPEKCDLATLRRLADEGVPESQDHDYKSAITDTAELAKDVAAFANSGGGVIFVGVTESKVGPHTVNGAVLDDDERRKITQAIAARVYPFPQYTLLDVEAACYMIIVEASPDTPHAEARPDASVLRYPIRDDTTTRYLREPEVALRYRDRFTAIAGQLDRLTEVWADGTMRLASSSAVWLALACVPSQAGRLALSARSADGVREWLREWSNGRESPVSVASGGRIQVGRRRLQLGEVGWLLDVHTDGSAWAAIQLVTQPETHAMLAQGQRVFPLVDTDVEKWVLALLALVSSHAVRAGAAGDLTVRAQLVAGGTEVTVPSGLGSMGGAAQPTRPEFIPVCLVGRDRNVPGLWQPYSHRRNLVEPSAVNSTVSITVASDTRDLVTAAASLAADLVSEFGEPEPIMLRIDGTLALKDVVKDRDVLTGWASERGVLRQAVD